MLIKLKLSYNCVVVRRMYYRKESRIYNLITLRDFLLLFVQEGI